MSEKIKKKNQATPKEHLSYAMYFFGQNIFGAIVGSYLSLYFTESGVLAVAVGVLFIVARIWEAISGLILGSIVERVKFKNGKYLPWVKLSIFLVPLSMLLMFSLPQTVSSEIKILWASLTYLMYGMAYNLGDATAFALSSAMSLDVNERGTLISQGRLLGNLGGAVVMFIVPFIYPAIGWFFTVLILTALATLTMIFVPFTVKERYVFQNENPVTIKDIIEQLKVNKPMLYYLLSIIVLNATNTAQSVATFFAIHCLGSPEMTALVLALLALPALIFTAVLPALMKRFDKFDIYIGTIVLSIVINVGSYFIGYQNFILFAVFCVLKGIGFGGALTMMFMFTADCVEYGHFKTGEQIEAIGFSMQGFAVKVQMAISGGIAMFMLAAFGFAEGTNVVQSPQAIQGIWILFSLFPALGQTLGLPLLLLGYPLRDKDVKILVEANHGLISKNEALEKLSPMLTKAMKKQQLKDEKRYPMRLSGFKEEWMDMTFSLPVPKIDWITNKQLDIAFGEDPLQKMDIYFPNNKPKPEKGYPLVIIIHGGGFSHMDKTDWHLYPGFHALERGFAVASINYRLLPKHKMPTCKEDGALAISFLKNKAKEFGFDGDNFFLYGTSAGGNIASVVAFEAALNNTDYQVNSIACLCPMTSIEDVVIDTTSSKPYLKPFYEIIHRSLFGTTSKKDPELIKKMGAENYIHKNVPPVYIQHGTLDKDVPIKFSELFYDRLIKQTDLNNDDLIFDKLEGAGHCGSDIFFFQNENIDRILEFFERHKV